MKRNETVTFLINSLNIGGSEKICVTLSNELIEQGFNVNLIVVNPSTPLEEKLHIKVNIIKLGYDKIYKSSFSVISTCRKINTDSLMVFDPELFVLAYASKTIFRKKFKLIFRCYNTLSKSFKFYSSKRHDYINKPLIKAVLRLSKNIIAQSNGMKIDLVKNFNVQESKIIVIPNPAIVLDNSKEPVTKENIILFVGRIAPQKGLFYLIEAFEKVIKICPNYKLLIVGKGKQTYENIVKNMVNEKNLNKNIIFEGTQKNISKYYRKARVTVLSSLFEGFPNVLVESISLGTPVVSFDCESGPIDIIQNEINGFLVPMLNVEKFATSIIRLINNPLSEEKIILSSEIFSLETVVSSYIKVLSVN